MKKNSKTKFYIIIGILVIIILVLISIILNQTNNNKLNSEAKDVIGAYYNNHWNGKEENIVFFDDMTCQYLSNSRYCEWEIKDKIITITLSHYFIKYNDNGNNREIYLNTEKQCNEYLKTNNIKNASCERKEEKITDIKVSNDGIVVYTHFFTKIK